MCAVHVFFQQIVLKFRYYTVQTSDPSYAWPRPCRSLNILDR